MFMKKSFYSILLLALSACNSAVPEVSEAPKGQSLSENDLQAICKSAISMEMGQKVEIMEATMQGPSIVRVEYDRPSDGKRWKYECKFPDSSSRVVWRGVDIFAPGEGPGRWRDSPYDDKYFYSFSNDGKLLLKREYTDGSVTTEEFSL